MKTKFVFDDDTTLIIALLEKIKTKSLISGWLEAPLSLVQARKATEHAGYVHSTHQEIRLVFTTPCGAKMLSLDEMRVKETQEVTALATHTKLPHFVRFEEVGYGGSPEFNGLMTIANHYISLGYRGFLNWNLPDIEDPRPADISLYLGGLRGGLRAIHPYMLGMIWEPGQADEKFVGSILSTCRELKLEEITE
jgi:hypothetical protein